MKHLFEMAGADGHCLPAQARIDGATLAMWNAMLRYPTAVCYAWNEAPVGAGLPAWSFRTTQPAAPVQVNR